jgi:hypothetical protein
MTIFLSQNGNERFHQLQQRLLLNMLPEAPSPGGKTATTQQCYLEFKMRVEGDVTGPHCNVHFDGSKKKQRVSLAQPFCRRERTADKHLGLCHHWAGGRDREASNVFILQARYILAAGPRCMFRFRVPIALPNVLQSTAATNDPLI